MKRSLSIVLLLIFLFNVGGYYFVFWGLIRSADYALTQRLNDEAYSPSETIELKIPVTLPYPIQQQGFKRVDGKFEHNGQFYKLVKQKLENDTLFVICILDHQQKRLVKTMTDYVKMTNELPQSEKKPAAFVGKFLKDFEAGETYEIAKQLITKKEIQAFENVLLIVSIYPGISSPPPEGLV